MSTISVQAECHCKSNSFAVEFLASSLPIEGAMCHCNDCRHSTGQLYTVSIPIHGRPLDFKAPGTAANFDHLKKYRASPQTSNWFCKTCNAFFFSTTQVEGEPDSTNWSVFPGVLDRVEGLSVVTHHGFVEDTCDGGIADHYRCPKRVDLPHSRRGSEEGPTLPLNWTTNAVALSRSQILPDDAKLDVYCHCKSIQLIILRPRKVIREIDSPFMELPNPASIQPQHGIRYLGGHCFCTDCRTSSGSTVSSWCFVDCDRVINKKTGKPAVTFSEDGSGLLVRQLEGTNTYQSSPNKFRESCAQCGAHVLYWNAERSNGFIDVASGLLDPETEGARAERFFSWRRTIFDSDAVDKEMVEVLRAGMQEYYGVPAGIWPEL